MNAKNLSTRVLFFAFLGLPFATFAEPTLYGKANVSLNKHDAETSSKGTTVDNWQLNSNASRIGLKGDMELDDGFQAIYQLEYEVAFDDGSADSKSYTPTGSINADCDDDDSTKSEACNLTASNSFTSNSSFKQRNIFVGIQGNFGKVIAGMHDTPLKMSQGSVDRFNDLYLADLKDVLLGEVRAENIVMYSSPKKNGFETSLAFIPGEGSKATDDNNIADGISGSVTYSQDSFTVIFAHDSEVAGMDNSRLSTEYRFNKAKIGAMIQKGEDVAGITDHAGYLISGEYLIDNHWTVKGQYIANTDDNTLSGENDTSMITAGADYQLGKKAKLYAYASSWETDADDEEKSTFGLGTETSF